ncbi:MAG: hypothetical protein ACQEXG_16675 [Pseudomonadota bacterium]
MDYNKNLRKPIIPIEKAIDLLGLKLDKFIEAVNKRNIFLIVLPKQPISIGIRYKNKFTDPSKKSHQSNPMNIIVNRVDGFVLHPKDNEKVLSLFNWKTCEPYQVVITDAKNAYANFYSPQSLGGFYRLSQFAQGAGEIEFEHLIRQAVIGNIRYTGQVFFFKEEGNAFTELSPTDIFITHEGLEKLKGHIIDLYGIDFNDAGGYEINSWSNELIKDINAAHNYLIKNKLLIKNIKEMKDEKQKNEAKKNILLWEARIRSCLEYRWRNKKNISRTVCFNHIPKIITESLNLPLKLNLLVADDLHKERNRNRKNATDLILLLDIAAEKCFKDEKGFQNRNQAEELFAKIGIEVEQHRTAIYSIIKESKKEKGREEKNIPK